jgi:hypothetical protein
MLSMEASRKRFQTCLRYRSSPRLMRRIDQSPMTTQAPTTWLRRGRVRKRCIQWSRDHKRCFQENIYRSYSPILRCYSSSRLSSRHIGPSQSLCLCTISTPLKAIRALHYANAICDGLDPIEGFDFTSQRPNLSDFGWRRETRVSIESMEEKAAYIHEGRVTGRDAS